MSTLKLPMALVCVAALLQGCSAATEVLEELGLSDEAQLLSLIDQAQGSGAPTDVLAFVLSQPDLADEVLSGVLMDDEAEAIALIETLLDEADPEAEALLTELLSDGDDGAIEAFVELVEQDNAAAERFRDEILALNDGNPRTDLLTALAAAEADITPIDELVPPTTTPTQPVTPTPGQFNVMTQDEALAYINYINTDYVGLLGRIDDFDDVSFADIPGGTATYDGFMTVFVGGNEGSTATPTGDLSLSVNLSSGATSGLADNFKGAANADGLNPQNFVNYTGSITVSGGEIIDAGGAIGQILGFDVNGSIDNGVTVFGVTGDVVSGALGPNAEGLQGAGFAADTIGNAQDRPEIGEVTFTIDGDAAPVFTGYVQIHAEKTN